MAFSFINLRNDQNQRQQQGPDIGDIIASKANQYKNQKMYETVLGLSPEMAKSLSGYEFKDVMSLLQNLGKREGGIDSLMGGLNPQGAEQQSMQSMQQPQQPQFVNEPTAESLQQIQQQLMQPQGMLNLNQDRVQPQFQQRQVSPEVQMNQQSQMDEPRRGRMTPAQALGMPTTAEAREQKKVELKERQILGQEKAADRKAIREAFKDTSDFRKTVLEEKQVAQQTLDDLNRLKELETGEASLDTPGYMSFLKESGLDIPALMNPGSEEFLKIRQTFLRDAKKYFGGRVSNFEMEQFLKSIPDLSNSPEGRKRIIANMDRINRAKVKTADIMRKVIKENGGIPPFDLSDKVDDRMEKERAKIAQQFKKDLERKVPDSQPGWQILAQVGAGKAIGGVGGLLKGASGKALTGAAIGGATGGVPGAITGGLIGGGLGALQGLTSS